MKRKFYDMFFAQVSIQMFLSDVAIYYHKQSNLSDRDKKKVDKIVKFLIKYNKRVDDYILMNVAEGENLEEICRECCKNVLMARKLVHNPNFTQECFNELLKGFERATNKDFEAKELFGMGELLISCKYMPEDRLRKYAKSKESNSRAAVAANPSCPEDLIENLAHDKDKRVRLSVARNEITPARILLELAGDDGRYVKCSVAGNKNASADVIRKVYMFEDYETYKNCSCNPNCPSDVLEQLAMYTNREPVRTFCIRKNVAMHPNATVRVYNVLKSDENPYLSQISLLCKACPVEELYTFNPKLKYATDIAEFIMERNDITDEVVKDFLDNKGAVTRAIVVEKRDIPQEVLLKYYTSKSKKVINELSKKLTDNEALMYILKQYGTTDFEIGREAAGNLGPGSANAFASYIKSKQKNWEFHLRAYLYGVSSEKDMWQVYDEFSNIRKNRKYPLAATMLEFIAYGHKDMSESGVEKFVKYIVEENAITNKAHMLHNVSNFDKFYSKTLLNMCISYINSVEA